ncbi:MAG: bifunctional 4-hydroxy-2-oxoglutarate aldolase/2-dehydro-3-deoxy-phosphogluconate aldolase [bacterium]
MAYTSREILALTPVVPVLVIDDLEAAVPLARALLNGGISVLEVTLRTPQGLEAIRRIKAEVSGAVVGAGTVLSRHDLDGAIAAGSEFVITPGLTDNLLRAGADCGVPFMPGVATVSEMMNCLEQGLDTLKFFPAEASGGAAALKAFSGPFPEVSFCPTGGIGPANIRGYLQLPCVASVGGSWMAPEAIIAKGDWEGITRLANEAVQLVTQIRDEIKRDSK